MYFVRKLWKGEALDCVILILFTLACFNRAFNKFLSLFLSPSNCCQVSTQLCPQLTKKSADVTNFIDYIISVWQTLHNPALATLGLNWGFFFLDLIYLTHFTILWIICPIYPIVGGIWLKHATYRSINPQKFIKSLQTMYQMTWICNALSRIINFIFLHNIWCK